LFFVARVLFVTGWQLFQDCSFFIAFRLALFVPVYGVREYLDNYKSAYSFWYL